MAQQQLARLRNELTAACRRRWLARVVEGSVKLALVLLVVLAVDFLSDVAYRFGFAQRVFLLAVFLGLALVALRRFVWPALAARESIIDLALQVERRRGIDSDLVAALQFETQAARTWGSPDLQTAVVERVAEISDRQLVDDGLSAHVLRRQAVPLGVATGVVFCAAVLLRSPCN